MSRPRFIVVARVGLLPALALALAAHPASAQRRISGRITDGATGEPVAANVILSGTTVSTTADERGRFQITAPDGDVTLIVRRLGYQRKTVLVTTRQAEVNVALARDVFRLEAQVITGAATSVSRRNAANDVARVDGEDVGRVPTPSIESALAGKIAGAQVIANSGAPGGGNQVRLRGVTSVFGSADPLYVVDGVIVSNDVVENGLNSLTSANRNTLNATNQDNGVNRIADLNPADVESIEVLKGASASAIYGSKASNGVIIIRTKRGDPGKTHVDVVQRFGTFDLAGKYGARRFTLDSAIAYGVANGMTADSVRANYARCGGFCDAEQMLFGEHQLSYETNVSLRGGSPATGSNFFISGINKYDGGIQKNTGYQKQGVRLNLGQLVGNQLTVQVNNNFVRTLTERGVSNNDNTNITPYFVFGGTPSWYDMRPQNGIYPQNPFIITNPFQNRDFLRTPEEVYRYIGAASATYSALTTERHALQLRVDGGVDRYSVQVNINSPRFLYFEPNDGYPGTVTSLSANVLNANANLSAIHTYTPSSKAFTATTSAGLQRETSEQRSTNTIGRDVILGQENVDRAASVLVFANHQAVRGLAFYAQEEFLAMDERLLLTAGTRAERSTVNGDINKFYYFPKASVSYRIPGGFGMFDEVKPRFAIGQSGNQPLYIQKYSPAQTATYAGQNALQQGLINGNTNIKPERQTEIEGGLDATVLDGRASLALTGYQKTIDDVILHITTAPSRGYVVDIRNAGAIRNRGVEAMLAIRPLRTADFDWVSRTTFARNVGIVTRLDLPAGQTFFNVERDASGQRVAFGPGYGIGRLEVGQRVTQIVAQITDTISGNGQVVKRGDAAPRFTMGFANEFSWKNVHLTSLFDWQNGGDLVEVTRDVYDSFALSPDKPDGGAARARLNDALGIAQYVEDASFVKLRELSLWYELPTTLVTRVLPSATSARLELSGRNLLRWTKYPGIDPEISNFGSQQISRFIDLAPFPPSRSYFFSLQVSF